MPGCVTVAILSTACVLTLSPVSHWGTNSSYWHSTELPLPIWTPLYPLVTKVHTLFLTSIPIVFLPYLWFKYILSLCATSVLRSPVSTQYYCLGLIVLFCLLLLFCVSWIQLCFLAGLIVNQRSRTVTGSRWKNRFFSVLHHCDVNHWTAVETNKQYKNITANFGILNLKKKPTHHLTISNIFD